MRRLDEFPLDPDIAAELEAIDATLRGEPVDPEFADVAELALMLVAERPSVDHGVARSLDERFLAGLGPRPRRRWVIAPAAALVAAAVVAVVVGLSSGGGGGPAMRPALGTATVRGVPAVPAAPVAPSGAAPELAPPTNGLSPPANGRRILQSAQLALTAPPARVDDVAQQVFDVIGGENGIVNRSTVTATGGPDGYAEFELSVPSSNLADTMARLSRLRYAQVASRTDTTQDVNDQYVAANRRLADAQTLRTALLKQLANATTPQQISSLNSQIHDADSAISSAQAALRSLNRQINYSQISVTVNAGPVPLASGGGGGFTIGRAAHDAGRVLTVAAGVALIALAGLVPLVLLVALGWSIHAGLRRRRREQALDMA
jgi:hypothetical protein